MNKHSNHDCCANNHTTCVKISAAALLLLTKHRFSKTISAERSSRVLHLIQVLPYKD